MKNYSLGIYEKAMSPFLTWDERMRLAKKIGFDYIEMSIDETDERLSRLQMSRMERRKIVTEGMKHNLPVGSICLSGHRRFPMGSADEAIRRRGMEIMESAIDLACDLGVRIIQIAGYDVYYEQSTEETKKWFLENLIKSVEMAAKRGVILGFETMETPFLNTVKKCMYYIELVNSPWLQIYPDIGNMTNAAVAEGGDAVSDLKTGAGHILAIHLKETIPGKFREIPFGTGHVEFEKIIRAAVRMGVRRFTMEMWDTDEDNWERNLWKSYEFLLSKFPKDYKLRR